MSKVYKMYLTVQGIRKVPRGPRYPKGTKRSKVAARYLKVQCIQNVPNDQGEKKVPKGSRFKKGT